MSDSGRRPSVLLAEDEPMLRAIATETLQDAGFEVFPARDGVEALAILRANPQIVLLASDIKMPRMDGYALAEACLALNPGLKILLMTGYAENPPPELQAAHSFQILHKPFDLERLCALAAQMIA